MGHIFQCGAGDAPDSLYDSISGLPPLSCLGRLLRVGCEPREEAPLLLSAAAAGAPEEVARCSPRPWLTPRHELLEIVVGLSAFASADCRRRPFPLPRRVFILLNFYRTLDTEGG